MVFMIKSSRDICDAITRSSTFNMHYMTIIMANFLFYFPLVYCISLLFSPFPSAMGFPGKLYCFYFIIICYERLFDHCSLGDDLGSLPRYCILMFIWFGYGSDQIWRRCWGVVVQRFIIMFLCLCVCFCVFL